MDGSLEPVSPQGCRDRAEGAGQAVPLLDQLLDESFHSGHRVPDLREGVALHPWRTSSVPRGVAHPVALFEHVLAKRLRVLDSDQADETAGAALPGRLHGDPVEREPPHDRALLHLEVRDLLERHGLLDLVEDAFLDIQGSRHEDAVPGFDDSFQDDLVHERDDQCDRNGHDEERDQDQAHPVVLDDSICIELGSSQDGFFFTCGHALPFEVVSIIPRVARIRPDTGVSRWCRSLRHGS